MSESTLILVLVAAWLVVFPLFWMGIVWVTSRFGWSSLAAAFPASGPPPDVPGLGWTTVQLGLLGRGWATVYVTPEGLRLQPGWLFGFGYAPVWIPWDRVERVGPGLVGGVSLKLEGGRSVWLSRLGGGLDPVREAAAARGLTA